MKKYFTSFSVLACIILLFNSTIKAQTQGSTELLSGINSICFDSSGLTPCNQYICPGEYVYVNMSQGVPSFCGGGTVHFNVAGPSGYGTQILNGVGSVLTTNAFVIPGLYSITPFCTASNINMPTCFVEVLDHPDSLQFTATDDTACVGEVIYFNSHIANDHAVHFYTWDFGDGTIVMPDPNHPFGSVSFNYAYSVPGVYTVCLIVNSGYLPDTTNLSVSQICFSDTICHTVIIDTAHVDFTYNQSQDCNYILSFFSEASCADSLKWTFTNNNGWSSSSTLINPSLTFPGAGIYYVNLDITDYYGTHHSFTQTVIVHPGVLSPSPIIYLSSHTAYCGPDTLMVLNYDSSSTYTFSSQPNLIMNSGGAGVWILNYPDPYLDYNLTVAIADSATNCTDTLHQLIYSCCVYFPSDSTVVRLCDERISNLGNYTTLAPYYTSTSLTNYPFTIYVDGTLTMDVNSFLFSDDVFFSRRIQKWYLAEPDKHLLFIKTL